MNHLDQSQHQGQTANNAVVMDQKQRTILCSMHYREVSTLNDLRTAAFALQSSAPSTDSSAPSTHSNSLVPPVMLRATWTGPFWIKDSLLAIQNANVQRVATESVFQETGFGGFRIGGLTIHTLGKFDSPESAYSETGLANDVDLDACYGAVSDKPLAELRSRDRILALPLGFKCSRSIAMSGQHPCSMMAEVVQRRRQPRGSVETLALTKAGDLAHAGSDDLETAWKITLAYTGNNSHSPHQDCEFFADSMKGIDCFSMCSRELTMSKLSLRVLVINITSLKFFHAVDAVDRIFNSSDTDLDNEHPSSRQYRLYLQSPDAFFGVDHPLIRESIRAMKGEKEVASRMWTRYREVQRVVERQCNKKGCISQPRRHQLRDSQDHDNGDWESTTAARVRLRAGSLLLRKRISRIGIARSSDPSSDVAEQKDVDTKESLLVPGLLQELVKASTSIPSNTSADVTAPTELDQTSLTKLHQQQGCQDSTSGPLHEKALPALEMTLEQLKSLSVEQLNNVALFWNGRKMVSSQIRSGLNPIAQPSQDPETRTLAVADKNDKDDEGSSDQEAENMDVDGTTKLPLNPISSQPKTSPSKAAPSRLLPEAHSDVRVYTTRSFKSDEVIMEYTGEVVHPSIAVRRQDSYQSQGRSCYMMWCEFQDAVIDATMQGGLARFIRNELRHLRRLDSPQQQRTVYARTVAGPGLQGPKVVICAAGPLEAGTELILRYC